MPFAYLCVSSKCAFPRLSYTFIQVAASGADMAMGAVPTWCRFQMFMGRLKSIALDRSSRYVSTSGIQVKFNC